MSDSYYERNREYILQKCKERNQNKEKNERDKEYQKAYMKAYRKEHRDELRIKQRINYREQVLEETGNPVVPTAKKLDVLGLETHLQRRDTTIGQTMHKRHLIERRLEINRLKAEAFKKLLSDENL